MRLQGSWKLARGERWCAIFLLDCNSRYCIKYCELQHCATLVDMKSGVVMVVIVLIWDFIFLFQGLDLVLYIEG